MPDPNTIPEHFELPNTAGVYNEFFTEFNESPTVTFTPFAEIKSSANTEVVMASKLTNKIDFDAFIRNS